MFSFHSASYLNQRLDSPHAQKPLYDKCLPSCVSSDGTISSDHFHDGKAQKIMEFVHIS